jgi:hypothetical protein
MHKEKILTKRKNEIVIDPTAGTGGFLFQNKLRSLPDIVDMRPVKKLASEKLSSESPLKSVLLSEPNELAIDIYLARLPLYFRLTELDAKDKCN